MSEPARPNLDSLKQYIPGKPIEEVERELGVSKVIKLASNENPLGPSPKALEFIRKKADEVHLYPDQKSLLLKEALAKKLALTLDHLVIGNGSDEIMLLIVESFLSAGEEVIISENTFSLYEFVTKIMDGKIKNIPLKNYRYDVESIAAAITSNTKIIWLCSPNNPTGTIITKSELDYLVSKINPNTIVVLDEAYGDYVQSKDYPNTLNYIREGKNIIVLRTFSKIYGLAGLRIGYGIGRTSLIKYLNMVKLPFNVNRLAQLATIAALEDKDFIKRSLKNNEEGKKYIYSELKKLKIKYLETEANFIMIDLGKPTDTLFIELMKLGVIVRPLASFGLPNAIRITIGTPEQNRRFMSALQQIYPPKLEERRRIR